MVAVISILFTASCSTEESNNTPTVLPEFTGSWQNTVVTTNWWVITEDSIINYGLFLPEPCGRVDATILSKSTFTFNSGAGADEQITMKIIDGNLVLTSPEITATHIPINNSDIPASCTSL